MSSKIDVLIADDHALIRNGLKQVIQNNTNFSVLEAEDGREAIQYILDKEPSVAVLDIDMPHATGVEVAEKVISEGKRTNVVFLTMHRDEQLFNKAMDMGVKGYVLKENTVTEIVKCIETVMKGDHYISPMISSFLLNRKSAKTADTSEKNMLDSLTATETKVLKALGSMKTNAEIADELGVSVKTIQNHRTNICGKLQIRGAHALLKFAVENKKLFA